MYNHLTVRFAAHCFRVLHSTTPKSTPHAYRKTLTVELRQMVVTISCFPAACSLSTYCDLLRGRSLRRCLPILRLFTDRKQSGCPASPTQDLHRPVEELKWLNRFRGHKSFIPFEFYIQLPHGAVVQYRHAELGTATLLRDEAIREKYRMLRHFTSSEDRRFAVHGGVRSLYSGSASGVHERSDLRTRA